MRRLVVCDFTIANRQSLHNADFSKKQQLPPCAGWARPTRCARQLAWTLRARSTAVSTFPVAPLGSSGTISISFGARNVGICARQYWRSASAVSRLPGMTKLLAMTCEDIDAQEAARIRLVERVVPLGELEQTTLAYAEKLAAKPPIAVQMCKKCINIATDAGTSVGLLAEEIQGIYTVSTKDKAEAAAAMLEKRPGRYTCE